MITRFDMQTYEMESVENETLDRELCHAAPLAARLQPVAVDEAPARPGIPADIARMPVERLLERF